MLSKFRKHLETNFPNLTSEQFLLACSGGLDSVVLVHLCYKLQLNFSLAHCNFQLRGAESDTDAKFVSNLAIAINKKLHITNFDTATYINNNKVNIQIAARDLRYTWFAELMQDHQIKTLVTAHHADDNLETFLINLSRGTGIDGLIGIPAKTDTISRPLLAFSREQILDYAKKENMAWREDASNSDTTYLRNKIRHEIVPVLKELHPTFLQNFEKTQFHLKGSNTVSNNYLELLKSRIFEKNDMGFRMSIDELSVLQPQNAYLYALLKDYGFTAWKDISRLLKGLSGKEVRSKTHRLIRDRNYLLLEELTTKSSKRYEIAEGQSEITLPIQMKMETVGELKEKGKDILYVDKAALKYPLVVRKWQKGDYFYPFGMTGKKKLSKYFKDEKFNVIAKERQWLLCSENKIVWVIGRRSDRRFSVTSNTKQIIKCTIPQ